MKIIDGQAWYSEVEVAKITSEHFKMDHSEQNVAWTVDEEQMFDKIPHTTSACCYVCNKSLLNAK